MTEYLFRNEVIFLFITYILGRDSPYYEETKIRGDNWDIARSNMEGLEHIIQMIYTLFKLSDKYVLVPEKSSAQVKSRLKKDHSSFRKRLQLFKTSFFP